MTTDNDALLNYPLFQGFNRADLDACGDAITVREYHDGENILVEGDQDKDLFLIQTGTVEVIKSIQSTAHVVSSLAAGTHFGELSFLDDSPRSTTVRAKGETRLWVIHKHRLQGQAGNTEFLNKLYRNIALSNTDRLRSSTSDHALSLENEVQLLRDKDYFNRFLLVLITNYGIMLVITSLLSTAFANVNVFSPIVAWISLLLLLVPVLYFVVRSGEPWAAFGITTRNWRQSLVEGVLISIGLMVLATGAVYFAGLAGWMENSSVPLGDILLKNMLLNPMAYAYFIHSLGQEFLARGVFQNSIQRALDDKKGWKAVLLSSFMFGVSHIIFGAELVAVTVVTGVLFGFVFLRHQNLLGVGIVHGMLGAFAFSISQLPFASQLPT